MTGDYLKNFLESRGYTQVWIASRLGIARNTFNAALNAQDIKTGMIERLSEVTGIPIPEFFGIDTHSTNNTLYRVRGDNNAVASGAGSSATTSTPSAVDGEVLKMLLQELSDLRKQNALLMEQLLIR